MVFLLVPLILVLVWIVWVWITSITNSVIIPLLELPSSSNISLQNWIVIWIIILIFYYIIFTKKIEWDKFKDYLFKNNK